MRARHHASDTQPAWHREKDDALAELQHRLDQASSSAGPGMPVMVGRPDSAEHDGMAQQVDPPLMANEAACRRISKLEV